jgi:adenylate cyclase
MNWRRLLPNIRYGTEGYPEKVARRLRATNFAAWLAAAVIAGFALQRLLNPGPWYWGIGTMLTAMAMASVPLLHRFGPFAAPVALIAIVYAHIFRIVYTLGTADGSFLGYLTAAALGMLLIGIERIWIAAALAAMAAGLIVLLHAIAPYNPGLLPESASLLGSIAVNVVANTVILFVIVFYALRQAARSEAAAERERARSDALLVNILPPKIAERLKNRGAAGGAGVIADRYDSASILFMDMAGFTARAADTEPDALVAFLDGVFTDLDALVERHGLEKIKTTGDAYMVVSGVPALRPDHAEALAALALEMRAALAGLADPKGRPVPVRIGIASGPVVAGVVGRKKFFYDVWGDAVNTAARMEQTAESGTIQVAPQTAALLAPRFELEERGVIEVRGKGTMRTWLLVAPRVHPSASNAAAEPIAPCAPPR